VLDPYLCTTKHIPQIMVELLNGTFSHVIDGKLYDTKGAKTLDVIDPATEK
jgi:hypothetical protein